MIDLGPNISKHKTYLCKHLRPKLPGRWITVEQTHKNKHFWAAGNQLSTLAPTETKFSEIGVKGLLADGVHGVGVGGGDSGVGG